MTSSTKTRPPDGVYITPAPAAMTGQGAKERCPSCDGKGRHVCHARVERVERVFSEALMHTKSRWARTPFLLDPWQLEDIITPVFGTIEWSTEYQQWVRTYRTLWLEVPRKNGKSEICAGIALLLLTADGEEGAEIYGAALDTKQARKVFDVAARMVELSPALRKRLRVYKRNRIVYERTGSFYEVVPADAPGNLGHNPHGGIVDEAQEQPSGALWDAIRQGMGTRPQPLMVAALTAGSKPASWAAQEHAYSIKVVRQPSLDPRRYVYIRGIPEKADWRDEDLWRQANPAIGSFLSLEALRDEAREAETNLRKQTVFRQFRLNQWLQQGSRWIDLHRWDEGAGITPREAELRHRPAFGGLDLSSTTDVAALGYTFPPDGYKAPQPAPPDQGADQDTEPEPYTGDPFIQLWRFFVPEGALERLMASTSDEAAEWVRDGILQVTEGDVLDYEAIRAQLRRDRRVFDIREIGYDPWNATEFIEQRLGERDGFKVVPVRQGYASLSPPAKEWERLVVGRRLQHGGNPMMRWMVDNVVVTRDPAGNIKPDKEKSGDKIDGVIASLCGLDRAMRAPAPRRSVYEDRGVVVGGKG